MCANKTDRKLDRDGTQPDLRGIVGEDTDEVDIFGFETIYTTGEFRIGRDALLSKAAEVGIPRWMLPSKKEPHHAFGRAVKDLLNPPRDTTRWQDHRIEFDLRKNDSRYSQTLEASIYIGSDDADADDGFWRTETLGVIEYVDGHLNFTAQVNEGEALYPLWGGTHDENPLKGGFKQRFEALFEAHQVSHTGKDINNMTYYLTTQWTDSIRLRDACYFVPASHTYTIDQSAGITVKPSDNITTVLDDMHDAWLLEDVNVQQGGAVEVQYTYSEQRNIEQLIDAFSALYTWINEVKHEDTFLSWAPTYSEQTHLDVIEIMDTDRQREVVERKVQEALGEMAEGLADEVIDRMQDEDAVATEVAGEVTDTLNDLTEIAEEYDGLLDSPKASMKTDQAVRRAVRQALGGLAHDKAEMVEEVLAEAGVDAGEELPA